MIENEEQWASIQDFERYQVSTFGRIKNVKTNKFMNLLANVVTCTYA
jgi:hypothetical protein